MQIEIEKKKDPNDYPLLSFRLKQSNKNEILEKLDHVVSLCNLSKDEDEKQFRKNTVLVAAIMRGLGIIEKEYSGKVKKIKKKQSH